jgi:hypothetical protein
MSLILSGTDGLSDVDGTAATPAIRGTDANTGIFFPAADTIGFSEGGAECARFDSSGNLGVGTSSPATKLNVAISAANETTSALRLTNLNAAGYGIGIEFADELSSGRVAARIATITPGTSATGDLYFQTRTASALTEKMRLDSSGNLLVGRTSANGTFPGLQVGDITTGKNILLTSSSAGNNGVIQFRDTADGNAFQVAATTTGISLYGYGARSMQFYTNDAERARIDTSGYVGIGTSSPSSYGALAVRKGVAGTWLGVTSNSSFHTSDALNSSIYMMHSSANSGSAFICSDAGGRLQMFCSSSATGGVYLGNGATSWTSASDERVKENLVPIENGLAKVASLRTVTGNYINDESKKSRAFLIAQDVEAVLPEAVDHSNPDELGLSYTDVIPLLVAAIKEQSALITTLTARITALESA